MATNPNVFARLHKWAVRQDENFLTESLAIVLEMLVERTPEAAVRFIHEITGGFINLGPEDVAKLEIRTQVTTSEGRPDLEIRIPERLAVFEVKCESEVRYGQLEGYREYLRSAGFPHTFLILLAKYAPSLPHDAAQPDLVVRWYEVADGLDSATAATSDRICQFLCHQFHEFFKERNMAIAQVGWQLSEGARALRSFLVMLQEAAKACHVSAQTSMSLDNIGYVLDKGKYWLGLSLDEPRKLWFGTRCLIDSVAAERLGEGEVESNCDWVPGKHRWWRAGDLESEEVHFYHRSKVGQIQWLEAFLDDCLRMARSIETAEQPPAPPVEVEE